MKDLSTKAKIIIVTTSVFLAIIFIVLVQLVLTLSNRQKEIIVSEAEQKFQNEIKQSKVTTPPKPVFDNWIDEDKNFNESEINDLSTLYTFKTSYNDLELDQLAANLGLSKKPEVVNGVNLYKNESTVSASIVLFDKNKHSLTYFSTEGQQIAQGVDILTKINGVISSLGLYDSSVKIFASYKRKDRPEMRYYELHRDWEQIGYPILNPVGLLNFPENRKLSELNYSSKDESLPKDTHIYETSDYKDGYARANDFNTMTIGIDEKRNSLISITSNIRPMVKSHTSLPKKDLLTKDEAFAKLKQGVYAFFLPTPSGEGIVDFAKVFPENLAKSKQAIIKEVFLAYFELPPYTTQTLLRPYFLFRGYSELESGYRINFVTAVLAQRNPDVAGVSTIVQGLGGQQQGTLKFTGPTPTPTVITTNTPTYMLTSIPSPTSLNPSITLPPFNPENCEVKEADFTQFYFFEGFKYGVKSETNTLVPGRGGYRSGYYLIPQESKSINSEQLKNVIERFKRYIGANNVVYFPENTNLEIACPFYVTSASPTLFLYSPESAVYNITIGQEIIYSDPPQLNKSWETVLNAEEMIIANNFQRKFLYYEYLSLQFKEPKLGWIIKKSDLISFSENISSELHLNNLEKSRLLFELQNASTDINSPYLFIGIIDKNELNSKLPLSISPQIPNIVRYHFYLKPTNTYRQVEEPEIRPIKRTERMILEIGAVKGE